jgi:hypothetical protein
MVLIKRVLLLRLGLALSIGGVCTVAACGSDSVSGGDTGIKGDAGRTDSATGSGDAPIAPADALVAFLDGKGLDPTSLPGLDGRDGGDSIAIVDAPEGDTSQPAGLDGRGGGDSSAMVDIDRQDSATEALDGVRAFLDGSTGIIDATGLDGYDPSGRQCVQGAVPPGGRCTNPEQVYCAAGSKACIYDYARCVGAIYNLEGRQGSWYYFDPARNGGARTTFYSTEGMPILWGLGGCGAWITGGSISTTDASISDTDAIGLGFTLQDGSPYDACAYAGIEFTYASASDLNIAFRYGADNSSASAAERTVDAADSGYVTVRVPFPSGVCNRLTGIEFRAAAGYVVLAVRKVTFY